MNKFVASLAGAACLFAAGANAAVEVGKPAPDFVGKAADGKEIKLSDYKGKIVVLEWSNPGCPFVKKFYGAGAMQKFQADAVSKGVVWLTINSSAQGKEGYVEAADATQFISDKKATPTAYILDGAHGSAIGHLYGAKTTPHMFVIDAQGTLAYMGALDDKPTPNAADIDGAKNYVNTAIDELIGERKVTIPAAQAYGCSVKY